MYKNEELCKEIAKITVQKISEKWKSIVRILDSYASDSKYIKKKKTLHLACKEPHFFSWELIKAWRSIASSQSVNISMNLDSPYHFSSDANFNFALILGHNGVKNTTQCNSEGRKCYGPFTR